MKNKNKTKNPRSFIALAAKTRNGGAMGDRRKKRAKERKNLFEGW